LRGEVVGWVECFGDPVPGTCRLEPEVLSFRTAHGTALTWPLGTLTGLQTSSSGLQLKVRGQEVMALAFPRGTGRYWEALIMAGLRLHWHACGRGGIREFQPRVVAG
jgi:hypothetical protein